VTTSATPPPHLRSPTEGGSDILGTCSNTAHLYLIPHHRLPAMQVVLLLLLCWLVGPATPSLNLRLYPNGALVPKETGASAAFRLLQLDALTLAIADHSNKREDLAQDESKDQEGGKMPLLSLSPSPRQFPFARKKWWPSSVPHWRPEGDGE
jgi:hypothetical protein